jgi:hypothetical protein
MATRRTVAAGVVGDGGRQRRDRLVHDRQRDAL